ncbi:helix-turn-helix domain-containing protein [Frankia sp. Cppng1_Ct_nod]|uniref:winged helix-turn-helix transcriptional regulator n=1 Tax=Frankia sp. Cppng1_Ct_nod TaxID=2897162 RepID=UPI0010414005|nr:helix-turn-helix domain-containing protein [Frankia sp. Cppng1_Ct_nod]
MDSPRVCSIARTLGVVGERWSLLVIREVALGVQRFEAIRIATGAPRAVLAERLRTLVDAGVLERRAYRENGARSRYEYRLTQAGRELQPVLTALRQWGDRHLAGPDGPPAPIVHADCGAIVRARHMCERGHVLDDTGRGLTALPDLDPGTRSEICH